ncbi:glycosyltransferase [bacterium]|nr:glycosyltransferase [bacterium]
MIQHGILDAISEKIFFQNNKCTLSNLLKEFIRFFIWRSANKILTTPTIICFDPKNENIVKQNYPSINTINIPLPSDNNLNQNLNIFESNNRRSIIYAGRIQNGAKNIASLIKLNKLLNNIIYFYGKPDSKNDEKYIEEIKSTNNYKGYFSPSNRDEYYKVLREYKFMILYSRYEGFSFSLVEALSQGIPIIVKDTYVSASFLCNSKTGLLLPRNTSLEEDSKIIKEFISKLTSESYFKMAQNCLAFYKDNLSFTNFERKWKIILDKYLK